MQFGNCNAKRLGDALQGLRRIALAAPLNTGKVAGISVRGERNILKRCLARLSDLTNDLPNVHGLNGEVH